LQKKSLKPWQMLVQKVEVNAAQSWSLLLGDKS
jgi:hypothetical protein